MKYLHLILIIILFTGCQTERNKNLEGVYKADDQDFTQLRIIVDGYISTVEYEKQKYIRTYGGTYTLNEEKLYVKTEFDDKNPAEIGKETQENLKFEQEDFIDEKGIKWIKQKSTPQDLDGLWQISGREKEGEFIPIDHSGSRKTIKLLKDGYFQWIAIEPGEQKFYGTGGGKYDFTEGKYTESILFFSKDDSRVGAELNFSGELKNEDWHHRGKSSKGDSIHEIWIKPIAQ